MPRIVIADSSPLRYLVLISQAGILPLLYGEVIIPEAVVEELTQPSTPEPVRQWLSNRPDWLKAIPSAKPVSIDIAGLDRGEHDAILLGLDLRADLLLMDDRDGVEAARRLGLTVTGTIGILDRAAARGLIQLGPVVERLRETNFRVAPALLEKLLAADAMRRKG